MTGLQAPVVRSGLMFLLWGIALLLDRDADLYIGAAVSALLILMADPGQLFQLSFQLTYLATLAIFSAGVPLSKWITEQRSGGKEDVSEAEISLVPTGMDRIRENRWLRRAWLWGAGIMAVSLAVQAVLFPLLAWHFHYAPLTALPANLVVIPWMGLLMFSGVLVCSLGIISDALAAWAGWLTAPAAYGFSALAELSAGLPWSHFAVSRFPAVFVLAYYALLALLLVLSRTRKVIAAFLILWTVLFAGWQVGHQFFRPAVQVWFLDVGQGDCAVLFLRGKAVVVDGGPSGYADAGERVLTPFLYSEGVRTVELAVLTHPHADHAGGLPALLDNFKVRSVVDSGRIYSSNRPFRALMQRIKSGRIPFRQAREGEDLAAGMGLTEMSFKVLNTASSGHRNLDPRRGADLDDDSVVLRLIAPGMSLLLTGDIRKRTQWRLSGMTGIRSDVLKAPHHGGDKYMVPAFYRSVSPKDTVILAGKNNRFGFPGQRTLLTLEALGSRVRRTDQDGAICVETTGRSYKIRLYQERNDDGSDRPKEQTR
jgi:competence protein ComEC